MMSEVETGTVNFCPVSMQLYNRKKKEKHNVARATMCVWSGVGVHHGTPMDKDNYNSPHPPSLPPYIFRPSKPYKTHSIFKERNHV
jgi:hypothetical protein